jgi:hypothetical protein
MHRCLALTMLKIIDGHKPGALFRAVMCRAFSPQKAPKAREIPARGNAPVLRRSRIDSIIHCPQKAPTAREMPVRGKYLFSMLRSAKLHFTPVSKLERRNEVQLRSPSCRWQRVLKRYQGNTGNAADLRTSPIESITFCPQKAPKAREMPARGNAPDLRKSASDSINRCPQKAPKAREMPARGNAPGLCKPFNLRAESPGQSGRTERLSITVDPAGSLPN